MVPIQLSRKHRKCYSADGCCVGRAVVPFEVVLDQVSSHGPRCLSYTMKNTKRKSYTRRGGMACQGQQEPRVHSLTCWALFLSADQLQACPRYRGNSCQKTGRSPWGYQPTSFQEPIDGHRLGAWDWENRIGSLITHCGVFCDLNHVYINIFRCNTF